VNLLDTSVAIDHLRGHEPAVALLERLVEADEPLLASELVRFELLAGARNDELEALEAFWSTSTWVPVTEEITRAAGGLARQYRRSHSGIDAIDYLIAATALLLEAELLTTNVRHFPMVEGLRAPY
jgi:predicted nucleic acid-binding protein